jgi:hypothetical protein
MPSQQTFEEYQNENLDTCYLEKYPPAKDLRVTNGHACVLRSVCNKIKWPEDFRRTEDSDFNRMVYEDASIKHKAIVFANLIEYRMHFTTDPNYKGCH